MAKNSLKVQPFVLTIAGSDPSCGAGIQADLKVFSNLGVHGLCTISCSTAQVPGSVKEIHPLPASHLASQLNLLLQTYPISTIKTGMLHSAELMSSVLDCLEQNNFCGHLIVDPVIQSSSGNMLIDNEGINLFRERFISHSSLFTPNLNEAAILLDTPSVTMENFTRSAEELYKKYNVPVLLKGGHLDAEEATDILISEKGLRHYSAPFMQDRDPHGTGCTYSAAIASYMALGHSIEKSVALGKNYITSAISNCHRIESGQQFLGAP